MVAQGAQQGPSPEQVAALNHLYMATTVNKEALCMQSNGGALKQTFTAGQPLYYTVPTANAAFLTGFWVQCLLTVNCATGSSATYKLNAGAPLTMIDSIQVQYGGQQHNFRPYVWKYLSQMRGGPNQPTPRAILAGQQDSYLQAYYNGAPFAVAAGNNTWNFSFYVPMNMVHPMDARGILPIQGTETQTQIVVNCANALYGVDPILNAVGTGGTGTGQAVTCTVGTIAIIAEYKDGTSLSSKAPVPIMPGTQTVQLLRDSLLTNVTAQQIFRQKVSFQKICPVVLATIVDGQQSDKFATTTNMQIIDATADATGNTTFWRYGLNTNLDVREFYNDLSGKFGGLLQQDLDEGILPIVYGPIYQQAEAGLLEGKHYLNATPYSGWSDFHYGVQLNAVGSVSGSNPRFETHVMMFNDLQVV